MIVKMKIIHLVTQKKDVESAMEELRNVGTVHVEHLNDVATNPKAFVEHQENIEHLEKALEALKSKESIKQESTDDWKKVTERITELLSEIERLEDSIDKRSVRMKKWDLWGSFDPEDIRGLIDHKVWIHLYEIPKKELSNMPEDVTYEIINTHGGIHRLVTVLRENIVLPFDRVYPPPISLDKKKKLQESEQAHIDLMRKELSDFREYRDALLNGLSETKDKLRFRQVVVGMQDAEDLVVLKGFCPLENCNDLESKAAIQQWAMTVEDPSNEDEVPTYLKNPKWVKLSSPALDMIEVLPGYKEVDISPVFMIFFTLFFALLIGDAAYALIFAVVVLFFKKGIEAACGKVVIHLALLLTGFTIVWGVLTGTYFGQAWLPESVKPIVPWLNNTDNLQWLCFTIAVVHLSIARIWAIIIRLPSITALAEVGWLCIVWGMYYLANMFVLSQPFPGFAKWLFIVGISLAFFFMVPFKQFFKKVPQEIIPFFLGIIGAGTDIISYIRLFAVGLATIAVADAANSMPGTAMPLKLNYFLFIFLHLLNMILAIMAILVHAIRLNVLEFSGHLGLEWAGVKYNPFVKLKES